MAKHCSKCNSTKSRSEFYFRSDKPHLLASHCKECVKKKAKLVAASSPTKKLRDRKYHELNRAKRISYNREYNSKNRAVRSAADKARYWSDADFRLQTNLRNRVRLALKRNSKSAPTADLIGCTIEDLKKMLSNKFKSGMTWDNYGEWQVDHIIPCSLFDLSDESEQRRCFHFSNLQPLWAHENRAKSNKVNAEVCHR